MIVFKFGGASVSSVERIQNVGHIMKHWADEKIVVIVSAMGKTTNALEKVVDAFFEELWINEKKYIPGKFAWQDGYGAFTYSKSHIDNVVKYVLNQPEHHKKQSFRDEYLVFLKKFEISYDEKYLFEFYD